MLDIGIVIGIFAILHSANGACTECTEQYNHNKTAANGSDTLLCQAVKDYVTCLEIKLDDASCTLNETEATQIKDDSACGSGLSEACKCQKDFFGAVTTCSTAKIRISCLTGKTDMACDGMTNVSTLARDTETYINGKPSCNSGTHVTILVTTLYLSLVVAFSLI